MLTYRGFCVLHGQHFFVFFSADQSRENRTTEFLEKSVNTGACCVFY